MLPFLFMKKISKKDYGWFGFRLHCINPLFEEMWYRFEPMVYSNDAESAQLEIHKNNFRIVANPKFWKTRNEYNQLFIICHEMCHVMFGHWIIDEKRDMEWTNIAQDIQVNEFLLKKYFCKNKIKDGDFCSIETIFKHKANKIKKNQNYLYYYNLLIKCTS